MTAVTMATAATKPGLAATTRETLMEWTSDHRGERYATTQGRYEAVVWQHAPGVWHARVCRDSAVEAQTTCPTLEDAWSWCEAQLAALVAAA